MSKSEIVYEGKTNCNAELAFQFKKAVVCDKKDDAKIIEKIKDAYMAKRAGQNIKENDEWRQKKEKVMKEILELKFKQNEDLKKKQIATGEMKIFEGTSDKFWGSEVPIAKYKNLNAKNIPGKNVLCNILTDIRKKLNKK